MREPAVAFLTFFVHVALIKAVKLAIYYFACLSFTWLRNSPTFCYIQAGMRLWSSEILKAPKKICVALSNCAKSIQNKKSEDGNLWVMRHNKLIENLRDGSFPSGRWCQIATAALTIGTVFTRAEKELALLVFWGKDSLWATLRQSKHCIKQASKQESHLASVYCYYLFAAFLLP